MRTSDDTTRGPLTVDDPLRCACGWLGDPGRSLRDYKRTGCSFADDGQIICPACTRRELVRRIEVLEAENERLREACQPFAAWARETMRTRDTEVDTSLPDDRIVYRTGDVALTAGHLRALSRAALTPDP